MGTHGLLILVWKGKIKAVYSSFDSYACTPYLRSLGDVVYKFLARLTDDDIEIIVENLDRAEW